MTDSPKNNTFIPPHSSLIYPSNLLNKPLRLSINIKSPNPIFLHSLLTNVSFTYNKSQERPHAVTLHTQVAKCPPIHHLPTAF